jgi:hypothetical protein
LTLEQPHSSGGVIFNAMSQRQLDPEIIVDTITVNERRRVGRPDNDPHARWLRLADIALRNGPHTNGNKREASSRQKPRKKKS